MAHFAELDHTNTVIRVVVIGNKDCLDKSGNESENIGVAFCKQLFGADTKWVQTSYNSNFRGKYAGIGSVYDSVSDIFI